MSERTLRKKIIRLANRVPALRGYLMPLLRTARYTRNPVVNRAVKELISRTDALGWERPSVLDDGTGAIVEWAYPRIDMHIDLQNFRGRPVAYYSGAYGRPTRSLDAALSNLLKHSANPY